MPEVNERLTKTVALHTLAATVHNPEINAVWYKGDADDELIRQTLLISRDDSSVAINVKLLLFDRLRNTRFESTERLIISKAIEGKSLDRWDCEVRMSAETKGYLDEDGVYKNCGYNPFKVSNLDIAYLEKNPKYWNGLYVKKGMVKMIYTLTDGTQLKNNYYDEAEGHRAINYLLKCIDSTKIYGKSEEHSYIGNPPKDSGTKATQGFIYRPHKVIIMDAWGKNKGIIY